MTKRPTIEQVSDFLFKQLSLDMSKVKNLQPCISKSQVIIEMESAELAEQIAADHDQKHSLQLDDGTKVLIPIRLEGDTLEVRVHDLPPYLPNEMIRKLLSSYGEVMSITDDVWKKHFPGVPNGTRVVKMKINKQIPSYLPIDGEVAYIKYTNQLRTCKHCTRPLHVGRTCTEVRKELSNINNRLTLAQVVEGLQNPVQEIAQSPTPIPARSPVPSPIRSSDCSPVRISLDSPVRIPAYPPMCPSVRSPHRSRESSTHRKNTSLSPIAGGSGTNIKLLENMAISPIEGNFVGFPEDKGKNNSKRPASPRNLEGRSSRSRIRPKK